MIVYLNGDMAPSRRSHSVFICPASDMRKADCPADWLDEAGNPRTFDVEFHHGRAEVPSNVGEYLVRQGLAHKTKLITKAS